MNEKQPDDRNSPLSASRRRCSRSEKRRAVESITFRVLPAERVQVEADADAAQQTLGSYIRARLLSAPTTPARRRPSVELVMFNRLLAELKRMGNNINQLARHANISGWPELGELLGMRQRHDEVTVAVLHALGRGPEQEPAQ